MSDEEFAAVAKRFSPTEADRREKFKKNYGELAPLRLAIEDLINKMQLMDVRFAIFDMLVRSDPPRIHVGMSVCCGKEKTVNNEVMDELRKEMTDRIVNETKFKNVVWEI
jgi:hypothetical protein